MRAALATVFAPAHLRRTGLIALIVGSWLSAFNHGDALLAGAWSAKLALKVFLNYLTPFVVANLGLLSRRETS
ncbi:MAG: nitrate/nitrite transporter NrtS [Pseudomonadota bacterium]